MEFYAEDAAPDPVTAYRRLCSLSPMPFSCFYRSGSRYLLCASPERFLRRQGGRLVSQPIKGTAPRGRTTEEDRLLQDRLRSDEKEQSENVMIVDLVRNDLSRIALRGTVAAEALYSVVAFPALHQMISTVTAEVSQDTDLCDILAAAFPMGSMTGAPKISAMQHIERHERTRRGLYSGTVGYVSPSGDFDLNVVIRSMTYNSDTRYLSLMAGSAITAACDPEREYEECLLKAQTMIKALGHA
jgi:para-aminobenzoate synthetase component 1